MRLRLAIFSSVAGLKGGLFSRACSATPSSRSPSDRSRYSASPLSTFSKRFSSRTPVWMRSTSRSCLAGLAGMVVSLAVHGRAASHALIVTRCLVSMVHMYQHTQIVAALALVALWSPAMSSPPATQVRSFRLDAPLARVMPLFTAEGERSWAPGWEPVILSGDVERGSAFLTRGHSGI